MIAFGLRKDNRFENIQLAENGCFALGLKTA